MTRADMLTHPERPPAIAIDSLVGQITDAQQADGAIAWWPDHKTDPWDHIEAAMGLCIGGAHRRAQKAFEWLARCQLADGGWYSAYRNSHPLDRTRETHHAAYIATGLYHYYLSTGDAAFIAGMWDTMERAIAFALRYQTTDGAVYWALDPKGRPDRMALLTGCSSICFSLKCALRLAGVVGRARPQWQGALSALASCINGKPHCFNMTKARYAMDWFYPVLCGAIQGEDARTRINGQWKKFVIANMGVRCVSDQPWVTVAETCELVLTLAAMGRTPLAKILFSWIGERTFDDNTYWCGFTVPDITIWPAEKISWTNAAVLLAADAVYEITPAAGLFRIGQ